MSNSARRGVCLVIAAPSGAGKSTITRRLLAMEPALSASVSATTRAPRPGEQDGADYHFQTGPGFQALIDAGAMLEWAEVFGRRYGTPRAPVEQALAAGQDVVFDIDWQGHAQLRRALPADVVGVFVLPPSLPVLEQRLRGRASDTDDEIARRMSAARSEMAHWVEFDHAIVNHTLDEAVRCIRAILQAARCAVGRQTGLAAFVDGFGDPAQ